MVEKLKRKIPKISFIGKGKCLAYDVPTLITLSALEGFSLDINIVDNEIERRMATESLKLIKVKNSYEVSIIVNNNKRIVCLERVNEPFIDYFNRTLVGIKLALKDIHLNPYDKEIEKKRKRLSS